MPTITPPSADEYASYYANYVAAVPAGDILVLLETQLGETDTLLRGLSPSKWTHRYAPGKWSVTEVLGHVTDSERVFAYRALRFARGDSTPLPGFEQDAYVTAAGFDARSLPGVLDEFGAVRGATIALYRSMTDAMVARRGIANGVEVSVRALAYIIAGHERHHVSILRERYL